MSKASRTPNSNYLVGVIPFAVRLISAKAHDAIVAREEQGGGKTPAEFGASLRGLQYVMDML